MASPYTSTIIANNAIQLIGDNQAPVTGSAPNFDSSDAGKALQQIYAPTVATVMRQFGWDFARNTQPLVATGNAAPFPWEYEWLYPANALEVLQVAPTALVDPNNPLPVNWSVGNDVVGGTQVKVIFTNLSPALVVYNNGPQESTWDSLFAEAVVRLLASKLAMAISGKPDTAAAELQSGGAFEQIAEQRMDV
jgi:hypothetical protein